MNQIKLLLITASFVSIYSHGIEAATVISTESVARNVRKVIVQGDDGATVERFELLDKKSCGWFPARLDSASNRWILTQAGENALEARRDYIRELHLRWEYENRRGNE